MATVNFSLSTKTDKTSEQKDERKQPRRIHVRLCYGAKGAQRAKTSYFIRPVHWDAESQSVKLPRAQMRTDDFMATIEELTRLQVVLPQLKAFILAEYEKARTNALPANWLKEVLDDFVPAGEKRAPSAVKVYGADMIATLRGFAERRNVAKGTMMSYKNTIDAFERFVVYSGREINFRNVCSEDMEEYRAFLLNEHKFADVKMVENRGESQRSGAYRGGEISYNDQRYKETIEALGAEVPAYRARSLNTIIGYMSRLSGFFGEAVKRGYLQVNPMSDVKLDKLMYVKHPIFLNLEELSILASYTPSTKKRAVHRDVFVFQCLVACRYGDLRRLRKDSVCDGILQYIPEKTKGKSADCIAVPLSEDALTIIERYKDLKGSALLPTTCTSNHNKIMKEVFREAGLDRLVTVLDPLTREDARIPIYAKGTSHMARRTFIGNVYNEIQDPNLISSITGHANGSRSLSRYYAIDMIRKKKTVSMVSLKK